MEVHTQNTRALALYSRPIPARGRIALHLTHPSSEASSRLDWSVRRQRGRAFWLGRAGQRWPAAAWKAVRLFWRAEGRVWRGGGGGGNGRGKALVGGVGGCGM